MMGLLDLGPMGDPILPNGLSGEHDDFPLVLEDIGRLEFKIVSQDKAIFSRVSLVSVFGTGRGSLKIVTYVMRSHSHGQE